MSSSSTAPAITEEPKLVVIDENVFLGTMKLFLNHSVIKEHKIMRVLTLAANRPDQSSEKVAQVFYKHISMDEYYTNNMILFFDECYQYISEAQNYDENIVILSKNSESMSVTIIIAFLMKKYRLSRVEAMTQIQQKWKLVPSSKFLKHLNLWQHMDFRLKANEPLLRRALIDWFRSELILINLRQDQGINLMKKRFFFLCRQYIATKGDIEINDPTFKRGQPYNCRKCDKQVFSERNIIGNNVFFNCKYICTEPITWILHKTLDGAQTCQRLISGPINCHTCELHIGAFNWNPKTSCQCPLHIGLQRFTNYRFFAEKVFVKNIKSIKK